MGGAWEELPAGTFEQHLDRKCQVHGPRRDLRIQILNRTCGFWPFSSTASNRTQFASSREQRNGSVPDPWGYVLKGGFGFRLWP